MGHVAAYLRKSRVEAGSPGYVSHEQQMERVTRLAVEHGDPSPTVYTDWDRSGGEGLEDKRLDYQRLKDAVASGAVKWVVAYDLSRLTRSVPETLALVRFCDDHGARVHVGDFGVLSYADPTGKFTMTVLAASNALHRDQAAKRSREQMARRKAQGLFVGRKAYGMEPGENVEAVLAAFDEAKGYNPAARLLNERGVPAPRYSGSSGLWRAGAVARVVQRARGVNVAARRGVKTHGTHLLSGLVRCHCGGTMTVAKGGRYGKGDRLICGRKSLVAEHGRAHVYVSAILPAVQRGVDRINGLLPSLVDLETEDGDQRSALEAKRRRYAEMYAEGNIDRAAFDRARAAIDAELLSLAATASIANVPRIDLGGEVGEANAQLRTVIGSIALDEQMAVASIDWTVDVAAA